MELLQDLSLLCTSALIHIYVYEQLLNTGCHIYFQITALQVPGADYNKLARVITFMLFSDNSLNALL